jgi:hypothetical protein
LVPVEASVSGVIGADPTAVTDERLKTVRDRYTKAMDYLTSPDDSPGANGRSKLETYVLKQEFWSKEVEKYSKAQNEALLSVKPPQGATTKQIKEARELYLQWLQEHGRDVSLASEQESRRWLTGVPHSSKTRFRQNIWIGWCMVTSSWYV